MMSCARPFFRLQCSYTSRAVRPFGTTSPQPCSLCSCRTRSECIATCGPAAAAVSDYAYFTSAVARQARCRAGDAQQGNAAVVDWRSFVAHRRFEADIAPANAQERELLELHASALYSFPLSLASYLPLLLGSGSNSGDSDASTSTGMRTIYVLGARSEATMPPQLWDELVRQWRYVAFAMQQQQQQQQQQQTPPLLPRLDLRLIGPEVYTAPRQRLEVKQEKQDTGVNVLNSEHLTVTVHRGRFHDMPASPPPPAAATGAAAATVGEGEGEGSGTDLAPSLLLPAPDAFVLFNPGIAHPVYSGNWEPSLRRALAWERPLLFTSFDARDCTDDVATLRQIAAAAPPVAAAANSEEMSDTGVYELEWLQRPHENAFSSLKLDAHQQDVGRMVRCNHSAFVVRPHRKACARQS